VSPISATARRTSRGHDLPSHDLPRRLRRRPG
jgi:hypothetical protein